MRTYRRAACLALLLAGAACRQAWSQSQQEQNRQARESFAHADAELNAVYKRVMAKQDAEGKKKLVAAQRAWVVFRDAQARFDADEMRGGSAEPLLYYGSRARLTRERTAVLKKKLPD